MSTTQKSNTAEDTPLDARGRRKTVREPLQRMYCSVPEAAEMLGVSKSTIVRGIKEKSIASAKIKDRRLVLISGLMALAD